MVGYQGGITPEEKAVIVYEQVEAIFNALKNDYSITYINSPISYPSSGTQRIKYPDDAIITKSANCIDGTVLVASALENIGINPIIVLIPNHAFIAFDTWNDSTSGIGAFETTLIGSADFDAAANSASAKFLMTPDQSTVFIDIKELRNKGMLPLRSVN